MKLLVAYRGQQCKFFEDIVNAFGSLSSPVVYNVNDLMSLLQQLIIRAFI